MRPKRVHFPRSKTIAAGFMTDVQVDLADFQALSRHNKGNRYLLLGIDVLSKRLFGVPVKAKKAEDMLEAFKLLLTQMPMKPHRIFSDKGLEFRNKLLKEYFAKEEIQKIEPVHSIVKASLAERAIRNVKQRLYRYFSQNIILNWIDVLPKILEGINKSKCRVHGMRPIDVNFENAQEVWKKIYGGFDFTEGKSKFKQGEHVRMSVGKGAFEKGYIPNWGDEILEVDQVYNQAKPIRYKVRDDKGEKFKGSFYGEELARVRKDAELSTELKRFIERERGQMEHMSCNWVCGVHSISYPFSWPSTIGTLDEQWMKINFIDDNLKKNVLQVPVPAASHNGVEALKNYLATTLKHQSDAIGSVEKPGAFIPPPSLLASPPRAERIKRSEDEPISPPLKTPPLYEEEEENKEKSPSPELITPPLYLDDENKDKTPSPTREEIRTPPLYLEEKKKEKSPIPSTKEDAETLPPKPKKERKEEQEPKAKENVSQKPTSTDLSTIKPDKKEEKVHHEVPVTQKPPVLSNIAMSKDEDKKVHEKPETQKTPVLSNIGVSEEENKKEEEKPSTQKPSSNLLSTIGIAKKEEKKEQDKPHSQPRPSSALSSIGLNKKEEKKVQDNSTTQKPPSSVLSSIGLDKKDKKEQEKPSSVLTTVGLGKKEEEKQKTKPPAPAPREELKSPPRYKEDNKTPSLKPEKEQISTIQKPADSNIPSAVDLSRKDEKKPKENSTQKSSVSTNVGLENNKKEEKKSQKRPASVLDSIGLESSRKDVKKDEQKSQKPPPTVLSAMGLAKKKDNMTQTTPPPSPTVLGAMGLKSSRKEQYNPRADKLFEVLFGKDYKQKETVANLTLIKNIQGA
uniref:Integrase catalytic domain-containing protein n=1 Tax=Meloidogyne incognita TaxID=6306 RepID=A0A914M670_MELIC